MAKESLDVIKAGLWLLHYAHYTVRRKYMLEKKPEDLPIFFHQAGYVWGHVSWEPDHIVDWTEKNEHSNSGDVTLLYIDRVVSCAWISQTVAGLQKAQTSLFCVVRG